MKVKLFILISILLTVGCASPEKKAQKLIKDNLITNMNDPKSYESVSFESLDSSFTDIETDPQMNALFEKSQYFLREAKEKEAEYESIYVYDQQTISEKRKISDEWGAALDSANYYSDEMKEYHRNFKSVFNGWKMSHTFRGKNSFGATIKNTSVFYFDKDLTQVTDVISEE